MDEKFESAERLYRAVYPPELCSMYWKKDGTISSAAFADPKGLSVDRGDGRDDSEVLTGMRERFTRSIVRVYVRNCTEIGAVVRYLPTKNNIYHSEIHGSEKTVLLSKSQRHHLAKKAVLCE